MCSSDLQQMRSAASPRGPHWPVLRRLRADPDYTLISRIQTGMDAVLGGLHATGMWRAIRAEYADGDPPATKYGEAEAGYRKASR